MYCSVNGFSWFLGSSAGPLTLKNPLLGGKFHVPSGAINSLTLVHAKVSPG